MTRSGTGRPWLLSAFVLMVLTGSSVAFGGNTITLEAEDGTLAGTTISSAAHGYSGAGYVTGFRSPTNRVSWNFQADAGHYHLMIRFRSLSGQRSFAGTVNGTPISGVFPKRAGFDIVDAGSVTLIAGTNTLAVGDGSGFYEIDRVDLVYFPLPLSVPTTLADPEATDAARRLMQRLVADYGKHTWSGQHQGFQGRDIFFIEKISDRKPLIIEGDLINYSPSRVAHGSLPANYTEELISLGKAGHVLGLCWHWNAPTNLLDTADHPWWSGFYTQASTFDIAAAVANTNSAGYALLLRDIDTIAVQLKKVAAADIPVLWRPLHESDGGWFWWGAKGPDPFKKLWRLLFHRLTVHHGLHNLIWVLASENPDWYPGDDVVDVVGTDAYPKDRATTLKPEWEGLKARFDGKKLIALTEFGGVPDIERMQSYGVWWSWFSSWTGELAVVGPSSSPTNVVVRIYQSPAVVTLGNSQ